MPASDKKAVVTVVVTALLLVIVGFAISRTSRSYSEQLPLRQQSKYFDFRLKQHPERIQSLTRFADTFIDIAREAPGTGQPAIWRRGSNDGDFSLSA